MEYYYSLGLEGKSTSTSDQNYERAIEEANRQTATEIGERIAQTLLDAAAAREARDERSPQAQAAGNLGLGELITESGPELPQEEQMLLDWDSEAFSNSLRRHQQQIHRGEGFSCLYCEYRSTTLDRLRRHFEQTHEESSSS